MKNIKFITLLIITFLYIFGPVFRPIGAWMDLIFVTSFLLALYGAIILKLKIPKYLSIFSIIILVFLYAAISVSIYSGTEVGDYMRELLIPVRILITIYGGYVLVFLIRKKYKENYFLNIILLIYLSVLIHAGIMVLQLYNPQFKDWVYLYTSTGVFRSSYEYDFRMGGLSGGSGGSVLSVIQSLGIIVIPWIFKKIKPIWRMPLVAGGLLIFFSILICGRSGVWSVLIFLPISIFLMAPKIGIKFWAKFIIIIGILIISFSSVFILFDKIKSESPLFYSMSRSLDTFLEYKETGNFNDQAVDVLSTQILLPNDFTTLIFGNGEDLVNTQFKRTLDSDIGYIRNIWSLGIVFSFMFWLPIIYYTIVAFKYRKNYRAASLLLSISLIMLFFQSKENYIYVRMFLSIYSLILFSLYFDVQSKKKLAV